MDNLPVAAQLHVIECQMRNIESERRRLDVLYATAYDRWYKLKAKEGAWK